jgi:uncharacterized protein with GYD domain
VAKYLFEASYEVEGLRGLVREGAAHRRATIEGTVAAMGGHVEALYYAFGDVDVFLIVELPDNVAANALSISVNQSGAVRIKTTVLLSAEDVDQAIGRKVDYRAPGA